jgi:tetratricopeptide (TPR) repeat protein
LRSKAFGKRPRRETTGLDQQDWLPQLDNHLLCRNISAGIALLDEKSADWIDLGNAGAEGASFLLKLAQWVDVGYRDAAFLRGMLDRLGSDLRMELRVGAYVRLELAEAFYALATDDVDRAILSLDVILRLHPELLDAELATAAHLWKGRAHRNKADYERAFEHLRAARDTAMNMPSSKTLVAVIEVQLAWVLFQRGNSAAALKGFDEADRVLKNTDHWIALGNIESGRGRVVRRQGDYATSLRHFDCAVALYEKRNEHHPNLARTFTNMAFVKRLLALELKRHIDASALARSSNDPDGLSAASPRSLREQHRHLYQSAIKELERAKEICVLHKHPNRLAAALLNAGYLHLDVGDVESATREAIKTYEIADKMNAVVLKARALILRGRIENLRVEDLHGSPKEIQAIAWRAKQYCMEALALAQHTENKRLLLGANVALGEIAANLFFRDFDQARCCLDAATALMAKDDADYVADEVNALRSRLVGAVGMNDTIRAWSQGIVDGKSLQEVLDGFAEVVVTQLWLREGRRILHVAKLLSTSPKKVRRLIRHLGPAAESAKTLQGKPSGEAGQLTVSRNRARL